MLQRFLRNESHDFASGDTHAVALGLASHGFKDQFYRGLFEIGEVHRNLCLVSILQKNAHGFDVPETATGEPDTPGDLLRNGNIGCIQVDVISDQRFPGAYGRRACRRMDSRFAKVGLSVRVGSDFIAQSFELSSPNVFKVRSAGNGGCGLVKVNRNVEFFRDLTADVLCNLHAGVQCDAANRHKWNNVRRPHPRVPAFMLCEIDVADRRFDAPKRRLPNGLGRANDCDNRAIMIRIHLPAEQVHVTHGRDGIDNGVHHFGAASFTKVGHAFDNSVHGLIGVPFISFPTPVLPV